MQVLMMRLILASVTVRRANMRSCAQACNRGVQICQSKSCGDGDVVEFIWGREQKSAKVQSDWALKRFWGRANQMCVVWP
jgi:hypothetical protein